MKADQITARFGGRDLTFKIAREDLGAFELYAGSSAFGLFRRIGAGAWTIADIKNVLRFATMPSGELEQVRKTVSVAPILVASTIGRAGGFVDSVLNTNPPGQYAVLALNVLGAALFGVEGADATFTDEEPAVAGE
jgi:hypothetical protein